MYPQQVPVGRTDTVIRAVAVSIGLGVWAIVVGSLVTWAAQGFPPQPTGWAQGAGGIAAIAVVALGYATVAIVLVGRAVRNPIGWVFLVIGVAMALVIPLNLSLESAINATRPLPAYLLWSAWLSGATQLPGSVFAAIVVVLLFPNGRPSTPRWWLPFGLGAVGFVLLAASTALRPEGLLWSPALPNPLAPPAEVGDLVTVGSALGAVALVGALALAALWMAHRYRHAHETQRRQLLSVAIGASIMTVTVALLFVARYLGTSTDSEGERLMIVAAVGSLVFAVTVVRFVSVTAASGVALDDVTFLFTDLQDSTLMYERVGDATAFDLVRLHFRVLEGVTRSHSGIIVKTIGDAIMARFPDPLDAVRTAIEMRQRVAQLVEGGAAGMALGLRIGLHRGPAIAVVAHDRLDYFGQTVNAAARIQALAGPGEIVLSDDVYRGRGVPEAVLPFEPTTERHTLRGVTGDMLVHRLPAITGDGADVAQDPGEPIALSDLGIAPGESVADAAGVTDAPAGAIGRAVPGAAV